MVTIHDAFKWEEEGSAVVYKGKGKGYYPAVLSSPEQFYEDPMGPLNTFGWVMVALPGNEYYKKPADNWVQRNKYLKNY